MNIQISVAYDAQTYDGIAIVHVIRMALNQVEVHPVALFQIFAGLSLADAKTTLVTTLIDKQVGIIARGVAVQLLQLLDGGQDNLLCSSYSPHTFKRPVRRWTMDAYTFTSSISVEFSTAAIPFFQ